MDADQRRGRLGAPDPHPPRGIQTLSINGRPPAASPLVTIGRQDVLRLEADAQATLFIRFRDFQGKYPMHCHNTIHEDHAMMLRFDVGPLGDTKQSP